MLGYCSPHSEYAKLNSILQEMYHTWEKPVKDITGLTLVTPRWGLNNLPHQVWLPGEFKMFAIKFREELETFISSIFSVRGATKPTEPISRRQLKYQITQWVTEESEVGEQGEGKNVEVERTLLTGFLQEPITHRETAPVESSGILRRPQTYVQNTAILSRSRRNSELLGGPEEPSTSTPVRHSED